MKTKMNNNSGTNNSVPGAVKSYGHRKMKQLARFALSALIVAGFAACSTIEEPLVDPNTDGATNKLTFVLPAQRSVVTYVEAIGEEGDIALEESMMYMFGTSEGGESLLEAILDCGAAVAGTNATGQKTVTINIKPDWSGSKKFYIVGNAHKGAKSNLPQDEDINVMTETEFNDIITDSQGTTLIDSTGGLLMAGSATVDDVENAGSTLVLLYRSVARFDIKNDVTIGGVTIKGVAIMNANLQGFVTGYTRGAVKAGGESPITLAQGNLTGITVDAPEEGETTQEQEGLFYLYPTQLGEGGTGTVIILKGTVGSDPTERTYMLNKKADEGVIDIKANSRYVISAIDDNTGTFELNPEEWDEGTPLVGNPVSIPLPMTFTNLATEYGLNGREQNFTVQSSVAWKIKSVTEILDNGSTVRSTDNLLEGAGDLEAGKAGAAGVAVKLTFTPAVRYDDGGVVKVVFGDPTGLLEDYPLTIPLKGRLEGKAPAEVEWAASNIYYDSDAGNLTFDDFEESGVAPNENIQGVFFKWGSLYGIAPVGPDKELTFSAGVTLYPPDGGEELASDLNMSNWDNIPYASVGVLSLANYGGVDNFNYLYYRTDDVSKDGSQYGDICRWLTLKGFAPGSNADGSGTKWRMPTRGEFYDQDGITATVTEGKYVRTGYFDNRTETVAIDEINKEANIMGLFSDTNCPGVRNNNTSSDSPWFPAAGQRGSLGLMGNMGTYGYYWSSSPSSGSNAYRLYFTDAAMSVHNYNRSYGFSIRCVKDK